MPVNVTLYDELGGTPSTTGTWTHESGPPNYPAPPALYNDAITFDSSLHDFGVHIYKYTVPSLGCSTTSGVDDEKFVTVNFGDTYIVYDDECATAAGLPFPYPGGPLEGGVGTAIESTTCDCPGSCATLSALPVWDAARAPFGNDVWFTIDFDVTLVPAGTTVSGLRIEVLGSPYGGSGIVEPWIAVQYDTCAAIATDVAYANTGQQDMIFNFISADYTVNRTAFFRVGSKAGNEGIFDINFYPIFFTP